MKGSDKLKGAIVNNLLSSKNKNTQGAEQDDSITIEDTDSGQKTEKDYPFKEAAIDDSDIDVSTSSADADVISITGENPSVNESKDETELLEGHFSEKKPEKIKPKKKKESSSSNKGTALSGIAIVLSLSAIGFTVYSSVSSDLFQNNAKESITSLESSIADLVEGNQETKLEVMALTKTVELQSSSIDSLSAIHTEVQDLHQDLSAIREKTLSITESLFSNSESIGKNSDQIKSLTDQVDDLSSRPVPKVTKSKPQRVQAVKNKSRNNTIAGATLSSIDTWGMNRYVVLKDQDGKWVAVQLGDRYKGWKFDGTSGETATFKRAGRTKKLVVEG